MLVFGDTDFMYIPWNYPSLKHIADTIVPPKETPWNKKLSIETIEQQQFSIEQKTCSSDMNKKIHSSQIHCMHSGHVFQTFFPLIGPNLLRLVSYTIYTVNLPGCTALQKGGISDLFGLSPLLLGLVGIPGSNWRVGWQLREGKVVEIPLFTRF